MDAAEHHACKPSGLVREICAFKSESVINATIKARPGCNLARVAKVHSLPDLVAAMVRQRRLEPNNAFDCLLSADGGRYMPCRQPCEMINYNLQSFRLSATLGLHDTLQRPVLQRPHLPAGGYLLQSLGPDRPVKWRMVCRR